MGQGPFVKNYNVSTSSLINRRRSTRIEHTVPIVISGRNSTGQPFREETETIMVSAHGANFNSRTRVLIGMQLTVENPQNGESGKAICIRINPQENAPDRQVVAIQLVIPRNIWGVKQPPADWPPEGSHNPPPPPSRVEAIASPGPGPIHDSSNVLLPASALEKRATEITASALEDLRRQTTLILQETLKEFESSLRNIESRAGSRISQRFEAISIDAEKALDHLLYEFLAQLTARSHQLAFDSEEELRRRIAELFSPLLKMASAVNPGRDPEKDSSK